MLHSANPEDISVTQIQCVYITDSVYTHRHTYIALYICITRLFVLCRYIYSTYVIKYLFLGGLYLDFLSTNRNDNPLSLNLSNIGILIMSDGETLKLVEVTTNYT